MFDIYYLRHPSLRGRYNPSLTQAPPEVARHTEKINKKPSKTTICTVLYLNIQFWGTAYSYIVESYEILLTFRYKKNRIKNLSLNRLRANGEFVKKLRKRSKEQNA